MRRRSSRSVTVVPLPGPSLTSASGLLAAAMSMPPLTQDGSSNARFGVDVSGQLAASERWHRVGVSVRTGQTAARGRTSAAPAQSMASCRLSTESRRERRSGSAARPILVTGAPRSGTTWLAQMLATAPRTVLSGREPMNRGREPMKPHGRQYRAWAHAQQVEPSRPTFSEAAPRSAALISRPESVGLRPVRSASVGCSTPLDARLL